MYVTARNKSTDIVTLTASDGTYETLMPSETRTVEQRYTYTYDPTKVTIIKGTPNGVGGGGGSGGSESGPGIFPPNIPPYSVVVTQATANVFDIVTLTPGTFLGRPAGGGPIQAMVASDLGGGGSLSVHRSRTTQGNMTLCTLPTEDVTSSVVFYNGIGLDSDHYAVAPQLGLGTSLVVLTSAGNVYLGGVGNDGQGLLDDREVTVVYT